MKKLFEKLKIKDGKTLLHIGIIVGISIAVSLSFFFIYDMELKKFYDFLFVISFFIFAFAYVYSNRKINKIRKKTQNWHLPLKEEEKKEYQYTRFICYYASFFNMCIYGIVSLVELLVK